MMQIRKLTERKKCQFTSGLAFVLHHLHTYLDLTAFPLIHLS